MNVINNVSNSTKWAFLTEILPKFISPISSIALARLLTPDAFGIMATVQMVISFADMLADAGFQRFIIQKEFTNEKQKNESIIVAIYTNLIIAFVLWGLIAISRNHLARYVGSEGLGDIFVIAGANIPIVAFSSIQFAVMRRNFNFKKIFAFRLCMVIIPFFITIPLAYLGYGHWALVIGMLVTNLVQSVLVALRTEIKLRLYYDFNRLKEMIVFSVLVLLESIFLWITSWCDIFLVNNAFNAYYLGIYRVSISIVNSLMLVVTGTILPVLYSVLSRLQNDNVEFEKMFFHINKRTGLFLIPIGICIFCYRDLVRIILFGENWAEGDMLIGLWGLTSSIVILYGWFCGEVYRAKGLPIISTMAQILHLCFIIPLIYINTDSFEHLVFVRSLIRFQSVLCHFFLLYYFIHINPIKMLLNTWKYILAALIMGGTICYTRYIVDSVIYTWSSIILAFIIYFSIVNIFKDERNMIKSILKEKRLF